MTAETDDAFRAIGRFTYEFSRLIFHLRWHTAQMTLAPIPRKARESKTFLALWMHTGEMTASPLADAFFAVAETVGDYSPDEAKMATWLRNQLTPLITDRNDFLHGEWEIGFAESAGDGTVLLLPPTLSRTKPSRGGEKTVATPHTPAELDSSSDTVAHLRHTIADWGNLVAGTAFFVPWRLPQPERARPSDVYVMRNKKVVREGPRASELPLTAWN